ncbi:MAG: SDR family oxidoreductase [Candidatus Handelsmanbacteria bacterium]|nr:SDR family oxidoreductase [Candidatus Handelsmanbacteria bacterium]
MRQFAGQVVIITGAGTGIGRAVAKGFAAEGARVALVGRRMEKLEEAGADLPACQVLALVCDVGDRGAVQQMAAAVEGAFGPAQVLVNNAGTNTNPRSLAQVTDEDWDLTLNTNLTGAYNCVRVVLPGMRAQGGGVILNIASIAGLRASKLAGSAYSAAKHGMVALTHVINEEEREHHIRACAICPGEVETPLLDLRPEPVGREHRARMLQPEDLAAAALFVAGLPARACIPELVIKPTWQIFS